MSQVQTELFALQGGIDQVSPALSLAQGMLIDAQNFEPSINGGYRRMYGYERFDGRTRPSDAEYSIMTVTVTGTIAVGNTVTGVTSAKTAVVLQTNAGELVVSKVSGAFTIGETLNVGGSPVATLTGMGDNNAKYPATHATYKNLAADLYRADIQAVPGSGPIRGTWFYNDTLYAFRNNVGGTAGAMYKSTSSGWAAVSLGYELLITMWATMPADGTVVVGHTSAATAVIQRSLNRTGVLGSTATGSTVVSSPTGTFTSGEIIRASAGATASTPVASPGVVTVTAHGFAAGQALVFTGGTLPTGLTTNTLYYVLATGLTTNTFQVSATPGGTAINFTGTDTPTHTAYKAYATAAGNYAAITLPAGGRYEFVTSNFTGTSTTQRMYGCNGVGTAFEFDGTYFVPIRTGMTTDTPTHITVHKFQLFLSFASSVQASSIGSPYAWSILTGAAELGTGEVVTGMKPQIGGQTSGSLAIFSARNVYMLYGNNSDDWNLQIVAPDAGAYAYTAQNIGVAYFLDTKGIVSLGTTQNYGNFAMSVLSRQIQPIIDESRGKAISSCIIRSSNQYRVFFNDGSGVIVYMQGDQLGALMYFHTGDTRYFNTVESFVDSTGVERVFAGGSDGYVFELERGTSHDGDNIKAWLFTAFNSSKSPRNIKRYRRGILQATCENTADIRIGYELNYGGSDVKSGARSARTLIGNGSYWDVMTWDQFNWDAPYVSEYTIDMPGNGRNVSLLIYGDTDENEPFTVHSTILHYIPARLER